MKDSHARVQNLRIHSPSCNTRGKSPLFHLYRALSIVRGTIIDRYHRKRKSYYRVSIHDITAWPRVCLYTRTGEKGVYVLRGCIDKVKFTSPEARAALKYYRFASSSRLHIHAWLVDKEGKNYNVAKGKKERGNDRNENRETVERERAW